LFAGSGALGLEALSRGAAFCDFIDCSRPAVAQIRGHLQTLRAVDRGSCNQQSAGDYLTGNTQRWDIVFIDPPFGKGMVAPCCELLEHNNALQPGAMVYIETAVDETDAGIPQHWALHRHKCAGGVSYQLFVVPIA
jgi:16S rRNA (guanine966-N2)-methyltransferase